MEEWKTEDEKEKEREERQVQGEYHENWLEEKGDEVSRSCSLKRLRLRNEAEVKGTRSGRRCWSGKIEEE